MLGLLKRFWYLLWHVASVEADMRARQLKTFDLVSLIPDPDPTNIYMIYNFTDEEVYMLKWSDYLKGGCFDADIDKQVLFANHQAGPSLYKINNMQVQPYNILMNASVRELKTYASRLSHVFSANCPLMGVFVDHRDGHVMLIANKVGSIEDGASTVYDLTTGPAAGILHFNQVAHVVRTKDIMNNQVVRPIDVEDMVLLLKQPWRKEVINNLTHLLFNAIRDTEVKFDKYSIYCRGFTPCHKSETTNTQITTNEVTKK